MTPRRREALEMARHALVSFDGLLAANSAASQQMFPLDTKREVALTDAALSEASETDTAPS